MRFHDLAAKSQADSRAGKLLPRMQAAEGLKNFLRKTRIYADPVIAHREEVEITFILHRNVNARRVAGGPDI